LFEKVFNHKAFTGRSGTFFAFEGLGSIYWHMVSKLHVAVYEICDRAFSDNESDEVKEALLKHFREIGEGIGVHKSPQLYGAFTTDPYSHTPYHKGAQQPGMTGQVKEDILVRIGELGVKLKNGQLHFQPDLLAKNEFISSPETVTFIKVNGDEQQISLNENSLAFSVCQVPVVYQLADKNELIIHFNNGQSKTSSDLTLDQENSAKIFKRTEEISHLEIHIKS
jgi:hypothetical protein